MKITSYVQAKNTYQPETVIWACAFRYASTKEQKRFKSKPVKGMLMCGDTLERHERRKQMQHAISHFVPFKKNTTELVWSKAVQVTSRCYADSETECIELYNELVQKCIDWHEEQIIELKKDLI